MSDTWVAALHRLHQLARRQRRQAELQQMLRQRKHAGMATIDLLQGAIPTANFRNPVAVRCRG